MPGPARAANPRGGGPGPLGDAPDAAREQLGAGDLLAGLDRFLDGGLVGLGGGGDGEPLGIKGFLVVDLDGLGLAGGEFVVGEAEASGLGLQAGEHQHERGLQGIGAVVVSSGQGGEPLGLLLAVGALAAEVLDHPAGGIGLGGDGRLVAFISQQGGFQFGKGLGAAVVVIGQLLGQLANDGGELLGLDAQAARESRSAGSSRRGRMPRVLPQAWSRDGTAAAGVPFLPTFSSLPTGAPLGSWCLIPGPRGSHRPALQGVKPTSSSLCAVAPCLALMPAGRCFTPSLHAREGVEASGIRQESRLGCLRSCLAVELLPGGRDACPAWEGVAGMKPSHVSSHMPGIANSRSPAPQGFWLG